MQQTIKNRTIFCRDNLDVLRGINSDSIDLIYLDPPFNKGREFHAPVGTTAEGADFDDIWTPDSVKDEWHNQINDKYPQLYKYLDAVSYIGGRSAKYYLIFMAVRLFEMHRILKPTGSIYLHCDPTASHYLKILMDTIFGHERFLNELTWRRATSHNDPNRYGNVIDQIFYYSKTENYTWNGDTIRTKTTTGYKMKDERGFYRSADLTAPGNRKGESGEAWNGYDINARGRHWAAPKTGRYAEWISEHIIPDYLSIEGVMNRLDALDKAGMIHHPKKAGGWPGLKRYAAADVGTPPQNIILDAPGFTNFNKGLNGKEFLNYPTQKPLSLIEKLIKLSSKDGDVVLDPFCGCATTCVAAERTGRRWVGIDSSRKAFELVNDRTQREIPGDMFRAKTVYREDIPTRTDRDLKKRPTADDKNWLYGSQNGACAGCQIKFEIQHLEIDHIVPQLHGGWHERENLQLLCSNCNRRKGTRPMEYLRNRLKNNAANA